MIIADLVRRKNFSDRIFLYILNQLIILDYAVSSLLGFDPRQSISTIVGVLIYQKRMFSWLPDSWREHALSAAWWWDYNWPTADRGIWTSKVADLTNDNWPGG